VGATAPVTLVLGGARSGKSRYAESLVAGAPPPWIYIATAEAFDDEISQRIAEHKARRDRRWQTVEAPRNIVDALVDVPPSASILVDCVTLWLSNLLLAEVDIEQEMKRLDAALAQSRRATVLVANEVGCGIVPDNALARRFLDLQGRLNQQLAVRADRVVLMVAGLPLFVKGQP